MSNKDLSSLNEINFLLADWGLNPMSAEEFLELKQTVDNLKTKEHPTSELVLHVSIGKEEQLILSVMEVPNN